MRVDRTGTFKIDPTEWGVAETQNGFPAFNVRGRLIAYYDEQEKEWIDWSEYDMDTVAFLCLFGHKKGTNDLVPTANHAQVMKVFNWDGESFASLSNGDYSDLVFQVRIKDNDPEYADKNPFVVAWIDVEDADPSTTLSKLDPEKLKALDSKYAAILKKAGTKTVAAVSAKSATPKTPPKAPPKAGIVLPDKTPEDTPSTSNITPKTKTGMVDESPDDKENLTERAAPNAPDTPEEKKRKLLEKSKKNLEAAKNKDKTPPPPERVTNLPTPAATDDGLPVGKTTKGDAWCAVVELKKPSITDEQLKEVWNKAIDEIAGEGTDNKDVTPEQWFEIQEKVLNETAMF